jgi:acyl-coenzyme A thioesterase PaaI-like protein
VSAELLFPALRFIRNSFIVGLVHGGFISSALRYVASGSLGIMMSLKDVTWGSSWAGSGNGGNEIFTILP